jgi:hypothetical protein
MNVTTRGGADVIDGRQPSAEVRALRVHVARTDLRGGQWLLQVPSHRLASLSGSQTSFARGPSRRCRTRRLERGVADEDNEIIRGGHLAATGDGLLGPADRTKEHWITMLS